MNLCQNRRMVILTVVNSFQLRKTLPEPETVELPVRYSENVGIASERCETCKQPGYLFASILLVFFVKNKIKLLSFCQGGNMPVQRVGLLHAWDNS